ncbi:hypothetical protein [Paractinoplanes lichenicola]|uniref:Uncharacterized protein n=1 Tax=Paractinoplanes lichenicola TaxID=2802976 RepID=A0ABS1VZ28_9ACTN|nr:hypothetical protein [Actinoplanes lichenicola]MBL7259740.1 hypothetical protein [Actinoplanes lichenicola]
MPYVPARDGRQQRGPSDRAPSVPDSLDDLHGHSVGVLELPRHMAAGHRTRRLLDLEDPAQQRQAYQTVLCQAADCCEINDLLNPGVLRRIWRHLHLPAKVRQEWEKRHPALARPALGEQPPKIDTTELAAARMKSDGFRRAPRRTPGGSLTARQMIVARTASAR